MSITTETSATQPRKWFRLEATWGAALPAALILIFGTAHFGNWSGIAAGLLLLICLMLHEFAHIAVALITRTPVHALGVCAKGTYIRRRAASSPLAEICIAIAGPLLNLGVAMAAWGRPGIWRWMAGMNAVIAISNMIPVSGSDGQRILRTIREYRNKRRLNLSPGNASQTSTSPAEQGPSPQHSAAPAPGITAA